MVRCVAFLRIAERIQVPENSFLKTLWKRLVTLLYLLDKRPPSMFPLYLGVYIFHYTRSKLMARSIPVLK